MSKLWGGRFEKETHPWVEEFTASLTIDRRLWQVDVRASIAHARMLGTVNVLKAEESRKIIQGLEALHAALISGKTVLDPSSEDIHSEIERLLTLQIGAVAGKLHTGRSRNDQVATASRLYLREQIDELLGDLQTLRSWLIEASEKHLTTLLPGLTHLQHAQPISLAHHLMAYFWMFQRDAERMIDCRRPWIVT